MTVVTGPDVMGIMGDYRMLVCYMHYPMYLLGCRQTPYVAGCFPTYEGRYDCMRDGENVARPPVRSHASLD
ncbi:unnamed protein product [Prunus armeniaca]